MSARAAVLFVLERGEAERSLPGPALADPNAHTTSSALPPPPGRAPSLEGDSPSAAPRTDSSSDQSP